MSYERPQVRASATVPDDIENIALFVFDDMTVLGSADITVPIDDFQALGFEGRVGQTQRVRSGGRTILAVGLGSSDKTTPDIFRRAAAASLFVV